MTEAKESLTTKIAHMSAKVGKISKSGTNSGYGESYNFIEYSVVAGKLRDLFEEYKVIIYPEIEDYECQEIQSSKGKAGYHYLLNMKFVVANGEDPSDKMECRWVGEATDYGDKGVNKAITAGTKYFIMRLLQVSERGDEDPDSVTPEPRNSRPATYGQPKEVTKKGLDFDAIRKSCEGLSKEELNKKYIATKTFKGYTEKQKETICKIIQDQINTLKDE